MKNIKQYYKELGKLVYAVAAADGVIQAEEREQLHRFVLKEMASHEQSVDSSGMNQAFYVDFEFDATEEKHPSGEEVIKSYTRFVHGNYEPNDGPLIANSLKLLEAVALAYTKKNEKTIIENVRHEMSEISKNILSTTK
ncbi:MAG: hypothetical protein IPJ32_05590 [Sphingobacteriaceae bacterium]|nr:hypothetical protein [Sphingobacteriaceae bacterium]